MQPHEVSALLVGAGTCRVAVVGDAMIDVYAWGKVERISPEAPVPVVQITHETSSPGGAANAAVCVAALGATTTLFGTVGTDPRAEQLVELLAAGGVRSAVAVSDTEPTITKQRIWSGGQQLLRLDSEQRPEPGHALERLQGTLDVTQFDAVLISDYGKGVLDDGSTAWVIDQAREAGTPVVIDPKAEDFSMYRGCTIIKPNEREARRAFAARFRREGTIEEIGRYLVDEVSTVAIITRGADGIELFTADGHQHFPVHRQTVYDVTGAGDVVAAVLSLGAGMGWSLSDACRLANVAARISVSRVGTGGVSLEDLVEEAAGDDE